MGRFPDTVHTEKDVLYTSTNEVKMLAERNPADLPWKELRVDVVVEATGIFRTTKLLKQHLEALSVDGTVANHFKTKLGLQLSLAASNPLLEGEQQAGSVPILIQEEIDSEPSEELQDLLKLKENQI